jgi:hypothetical protein
MPTSIFSVVAALAFAALAYAEMTGAYFAHRDHSDRRKVITEIGDHDRSAATLGL